MVDNAVTNALKNLTLSEVNFDWDSKELGRGAYGRVFTVKYCGRTFAAKEIHSILLKFSGKEEKDAIRKSFLRECFHWSNLRHPNIVQFIGVYWPEQQTDLPVMVMELMQCNLTAFIDRYPDTKLKYKYSILRDVAYGLVYLHAQDPPVIHRDLTPNNVLMTDQLVAKIGDLGVAKAMQTGGKKVETQLKQTKVPGTADFMPPESFSENLVYNASLDVFSYGGIILYVFTGQWPTPGAATEFDQKTRQIKGITEAERRWVYLSQLDDDLRHLAEKCFDNDLKRRPVILKVLQEIEKLKEKSKEIDTRLHIDTAKPAVKPHGHHFPVRSISEPAKPSVKSRHMNTPPHIPVPHHSPIHDTPKSTLSGLGKALQSGNYDFTWTKCTKIPAPMYGASVAGDDQDIYVAAGCAPDIRTYERIYWYTIKNGKWTELPSPGHNLGILCMVNGKLNVFGGCDEINKSSSKKVSTLDPDTKSWIRYFPDMIKVRTKPGVAVYLEHIIVAGGALDKNHCTDCIEILDWQQPQFEWERVDITLPVPMWAMNLTVSGDKVFIVGYTQAKGRSASAYHISVTAIVEQPLYSNKEPTENWVKVCSAPHHDTALVPYSNPPIVVGGSSRDEASSDISIYSPSENCWKMCGSLSSPRINAAVASVYNNSIIVIGGNTKAKTFESAMMSTLDLIELGKLKRLNKPTVPPRARVEIVYDMCKEDLPIRTFKDNTELVHVMCCGGPYQINCNGQIGGSFVWNDCGLELTFPPKCSQQNIHVTLSAFLPIRREVQPGVYIVSAVYQFKCNVTHFDVPIMLRLQHCVNLQSEEDCRKIWFVSQHGGSITIKQHGIFEIENYYGTLTLNSFCTKYIIWSQKRNYQGAPIRIVILPDSQNYRNYEVEITSSHVSNDSESVPDVSHDGHKHSSSHHHSFSTSVDNNSCNSKKEQELPWGYEWMLALPKDHLKLTKWNGIYTVYINLAAWRKISVESIQADNITVPFFFSVNALKFNAGGVATVSYNSSSTTSWYIDCWPKEIKKKDVDIGFLDYDRMKDPNYKEYKLLTMILKSRITVNKEDYFNNASPNCQLIVKGIVPFLQVDLCTDHYDNLTILGTIESHSDKVNTGPVAVAFGSEYTGHSLHCTSTQSTILQQEPEMADLNTIVIPRIKAEWEDVAFALRYKIVTVNSIKEKHKEDPKKCCRELFTDWLSTDHGVSPKTWSTLLNKLKEVENLATATKEISNEIEKLPIRTAT